jgi:hypothetical protein
MIKYTLIKRSGYPDNLQNELGGIIPLDKDNRDRSLYDQHVADGLAEIVEVDDTPVETYVEKRKKNIADGGYGTVTEQLEMIGEQGVTAFQSHINAVKAGIPKDE